MGLIDALFNRSEVEETVKKFRAALPYMSLDDQAAYAEMMRNNPLFMFLIDSMKSRLTELWSSSGVGEVEEREEIHKTIKLLDNIVKHVEACMNAVEVKKQQDDYLKSIF